MPTGPSFASVPLMENVSPLVITCGALDEKYTDAAAGAAIQEIATMIIAITAFQDFTGFTSL